MKSPTRNLSELSSEKKKQLFELLLKGRGIDLPSVRAIPRRDTSKPCLLSAAQEWLWSARLSGLEGEACNEAVLLRLSGTMNVHAMIQALNQVVRRHEILRTRFVEVGGQLCQQTGEHMKLEVPLMDLSHMPASEREAKWQLLYEQQVNSPFNPEQSPLIKCCIIALSAIEQLLIVTLPRIVCDRWSKKILVNELGQLYKSNVFGKQSCLTRLDIHYGDFAMWQRSRLEAGDLDRDIEYCREKLKGGIPLTLIGVDRPAPMTPSRKMESCEVRLGAEVSRRVRHIVERLGLTAFMILLAGAEVLVSRYSGQEDVAVSTTLANRSRSELQAMIGPVCNTLLIKVNLKGNPSLREILERVREETIEAIEHQELPCEWIASDEAGVADYGLKRASGLLFVMDEAVEEEIEFGDLKATWEDVDRNVGHDNLTIFMRQAGERFEGRIEYNTALFDAETIKQMAAVYERLISVVVSNLDCRVRNLPPLVV